MVHNFKVGDKLIHHGDEIHGPIHDQRFDGITVTITNIDKDFIRSSGWPDNENWWDWAKNFTKVNEGIRIVW